MPLGTPYITPQMLMNAPTGISWSIIPVPQSDEPQQIAEATNICWRATSIVDTYCRQPLRATTDNELLVGPGRPRCNVDRNTGLGVLQMRRWPILNVLAIQTPLSRSFPRAWSAVPQGMWSIRHPLISAGDSASATAPDGGWTIDVAQGYIDWCYGRGGQQALVSYQNGWPHTSLTASAAADTTTLDVDDVTAWTNVSGFIYDGASTEPITVASVEANNPIELPNGVGTAQAGPGTVTLTAPTSFPHAEDGTGPIVVTSLPAIAIQATILACCVQALEAGIDSLAIQTISGEHLTTGMSTKDLSTEYELMLDDFRRLI